MKVYRFKNGSGSGELVVRGTEADFVQATLFRTAPDQTLIDPTDNKKGEDRFPIEEAGTYKLWMRFKPAYANDVRDSTEAELVFLGAPGDPDPERDIHPSDEKKNHAFHWAPIEFEVRG